MKLFLNILCGLAIPIMFVAGGIVWFLVCFAAAVIFS